MYKWVCVISILCLGIGVKAVASEPAAPTVSRSPEVVMHEILLPKKTIVKPKIPVVGWVEHIHIDGAKYPVKAKLDTGARTSSIDARIVKIFQKDNDKKDWVVYRVLMDDNKEETFENQITRWVKIKTKTKKFIRRPVVKMNFCIGVTNIEGEVNLADRSHFIYPVLVGRNMLTKNVVVDVSKKFTTSPKCKVKAP